MYNKCRPGDLGGKRRTPRGRNGPSLVDIVSIVVFLFNTRNLRVNAEFSFITSLGSCVYLIAWLFKDLRFH